MPPARLIPGSSNTPDAPCEPEDLEGLVDRRLPEDLADLASLEVLAGQSRRLRPAGLAGPAHPGFLEDLVVQPGPAGPPVLVDPEDMIHMR